KFGYNLDGPNHSLTVGNASDTNNYEIRVSYKAYDPYYFDNIAPGPSQGVMTVKDMTIEAMRAMAEYYALRSTYGSAETNFLYFAFYENNNNEEFTLTNVGDMSDRIDTFGKYLTVSGDLSVRTNIEPQPADYIPDTKTFEFANTDGNVFEIGIDTLYLYNDRYRAASDSYEGYVKRAYYWLAAMIAGALMTLITLVPVVRDTDVQKQNKYFRMDKLPIEGMTVLLAFAAVCVYGVIRAGLYNVMEVLAEEGTWNFWCKTVKMVIVYVFCVIILCSMYRRAYQGGVFKNSLVNRAMIALTDDNDNAVWTTALSFAIFLSVNAVCIAGIVWCFINRDVTRFYVFGALILAAVAIVFNIFAFVKMYGRVRQRLALNNALKRISEGDVEYEVPEAEFTGSELEAARSINSISVGLGHAINEQVKADRLKADLITNVSHDIKTPLTSIINYVDLIKRENIDNEKVHEYIDVLDRKSARLKKLTEDLVEASKASSGNVKLEMNRLDMAELAGQAGGEFDDKFAARRLELNLSVPGEAALIWADGRHLWRVFENLYNNAAKYAMEGTRIYAEVVKEGGDVIFRIKNVSQDKLNISPDELTERFIRGDVSRSTEGSGLGLSIAKSLTSLMGGKLIIEIDGDLYKASVVFPEYAGQAEMVEDANITIG
ncbi:MAG: HAMP domain-containing sensor histidine kinase, partial [Eubacteriales bacterium]|nr:HAMP domain-containing sensor histidine kinase [Eubacteriales bacterium]